MLPLIPLGLLNQEDPECPVGESDPVSNGDWQDYFMLLQNVQPSFKGRNIHVKTSRNSLILLETHCSHSVCVIYSRIGSYPGSIYSLNPEFFTVFTAFAIEGVQTLPWLLNLTSFLSIDVTKDKTISCQAQEQSEVKDVLPKKDSLNVLLSTAFHFSSYQFFPCTFFFLEQLCA